MNIDPNTTVGKLLEAIPSTAAVFDKFGMRTSGSDEKTLDSMCADYGIHVQEFLDGIDNIDWNEESLGRSTADL